LYPFACSLVLFFLFLLLGCRGRLSARDALSERPAFEWTGSVIAQADLKSAIIALKDFSREGRFEIQ